MSNEIKPGIHAHAHADRYSDSRSATPIRLLKRMSVNQNILIILVSLYLAVTANITFFSKTLTIYPLSQNFGFIASLAVLLFALTWLIIQLISYRLTVKLVLIFMVMVGAITSYFTDTYGTVFDTNMLINGLQTDSAEAGDLLSLGFIFRVFLLGVIPSVLIASLKITKLGWKKGIIQKVITLLTSLVVIAICILPYGDQFASFFRQHKPVRYYVNPITPVYSAIKLAGNLIEDIRRPKSLIPHASDAKKISLMGADNTTIKPKLMVFVVGEAARADHIGLNGYERQTTPLLADLSDVYSYKKASSCGTSTAYSVPCMFSYADRSDYDMNMAQYNENVLDTLNKQGVNVIWRDNNSSSKGVAERVTYEDFRTNDNNPACDAECRDIGMLKDFDKMVSSASTGTEKSNTKAKKDTLIVLHQMGNHGPAYYKRYPKEFETFTPVCSSSDLSKCDPQFIINGYDNAIIYTDYFLSEVIDTLKKYESDYDVVMIYVSDHGESLGENNIYLHGLPYSIAPEAQKHIPAIVWSPSTNNIDPSSIEKLLNEPVSQDYITPTLLRFFDITTQEVASKPTFFDTK